MTSFARKVRERCKELDLAHAEVARRSGLTERRFGHYVAGTREPDLATLLKICATLETSPNALLGVEETTKKDRDNSDREAIVAGLALLTPSNLRLLKAMVGSMITQQRTAKRDIKR